MTLMDADDSAKLYEECPVCQQYGSVFTVELGPAICPLCLGDGVVAHCC